MDGEIFSKEKGSYKIYWEIVPLNHYRGTIDRVGQYESQVLFQVLQKSFQWFNYKFRIKIKIHSIFLKMLKAEN